MPVFFDQGVHDQRLCYISSIVSRTMKNLVTNLERAGVLMQLAKRFFVSIILIFLTSSAQAQSIYSGRPLTVQEVQRVKAVKALLDGVDTKSLQETIRELERSRHPQINLQMQEAMAKTFTDIVRDINVEGQKKKEWLYSMICLNMAYLQFGGSQGKAGSTTELNRLIRQKLKQYLPPNVSKQTGFLYSL